MRTLVFTLFAASCSVVFGQSSRSDILPLQARAGALTKAESILDRRSSLAEEVPATLKNPFSPTQDVVVNEPIRTRSGKELIAILAAQLQPTGSASRDGEKFLLLGQRKVKVGERVPIAFENAQYEVEITSIDGSTFTIRRNDEEFTRPIKPGKNQ
jgi:hypothetical protein